MKHFLPVPQGDRCMHEFVASAARVKSERDIAAMDIAKRLLGLRLPRPNGLLPPDRQGGDHDRADRDREQGHSGRLRGNAGMHRPRDPEQLHDAPATTPVSRPDEVRAARQPQLTWKPRG